MVAPPFHNALYGINCRLLNVTYTLSVGICSAVRVVIRTLLYHTMPYDNGTRRKEFHDHIWNHNVKCIQISTNMPCIGSLIREIAVKMSEMLEIKINFAQ